MGGRDADRRIWPLWLAVLLLAWPGAARAGDFYYLMVFGSQRASARPKYCHTFATFVRASGTGPGADAYHLEAYTISWFPATYNIRVGALLPEPGRNADLYDTLRWAYATGQRVSMWGPYRIDAALFACALRQAALLQSGAVCYQAIDSGRRTDAVSNCIHAVSSVVEGHRRHLFIPGWGETASYHVARLFEPWFLDGGCTHPWVSSRLGLDRYPLLRRSLAEG
jgi:hypothetical protein